MEETAVTTNHAQIVSGHELLVKHPVSDQPKRQPNTNVAKATINTIAQI